MTTINPTGAGNGPLISRDTQTLGTTLNRIGKALTIRGGKGAADSVQISASASNAAGAAGNANLRALLADLESIVAEAARDNAGADVRAEAQRQIDEAAGVISEVAGLRSSEGDRALNGGGQYAISNQHGGVSELAIQADLGFRERLDVDLLLTQSAQRGGLFLSLGGAAIDLGTGSSFIFEVGGAAGARTLSFASGTTITDVAAAINTFSDVTGTEATVSGTGIRIDSVADGSDQFVSLSIIDAGSIVHADGIHRLTTTDTSTALVVIDQTYNLTNPVTDYGQDVEGDINGEAFIGNGSHVSASFLGGRVVINDMVLNTNMHSRPDIGVGVPTRAFTIIGSAQTGVDGPIDDVPLGGSSPLSPFASSGQQSGDFIAALDAIRLLQDQLGAPITDDFLADIRRELLESVGKSLGVDPTSPQQRTLDLLGGSTA